MTAPRLAPTHRQPLGRISAFEVHWNAKEHSVTPYTGQAVSAFAFTTANNVLGSDGVTVSAIAGMPRWQMQDIDGTITGRETATLLLGSSDTLAWDVWDNDDITAVEATLMLEFVQPASFPASGTGLAYIGNDAITAGRFFIDSTSTQYRVTWHNGTTSVTSTMTGTAPTSGQLVRLRATLASDGKVQIHQSINGAAETSATQSGALALVKYGRNTRLRLNGIGSGSKTSYAAVRVVLAAGTWTLSGLLNRF